ncbi:MAG: glycosyltransferase [Aureispira sp.]
MTSKKKYRIFITSNEPWGKVWFSKQHYANELAKLGHEVYFLNAPTSWSFRHLINHRIHSRVINDNLQVIDYNNILPLRLAKNFTLKVNDYFNTTRIYKALPPSTLPILWWKFDPFRFAHLPNGQAKQRTQEIYHITDPFDHIFSDSILAQKADIVVTVLKRYLPHYQQFSKKKVVYIPHGISSDEFHIDPTINEAYTQFEGAILKIGTINDHYNIELLLAIAKQFPERKLVLVGPNKLTIPIKQQQFDSLKTLENVVVEGAQKATVLKYYVHQASVCIVPYDFNIESLKGTPLKVLNYLAQGKVSITSIATDLEHLLGKGLIKSDNKEHFLEQIQAAIDGNIPIDTPYLHSFFEKVSYPFLIHQILHELD